MEFLSVHLPIADMQFSVLVLLAIGFFVGTLSGFFGVGGGWVVTPALNIFGFPMPLAVGTSLVQTFGQSIIATIKHGRMGNVDWKMGLLSILGSIGGVEVGKRAIFFLQTRGFADAGIRWAYIAFLTILGAYILRDYLLAQSAREAARANTSAGHTAPATTRRPAVQFRNLDLPPHVSLPSSGIEKISFWSLFAVFFASGFLSGFMGVGGGFILLPALIYLIGAPTTTAIGTSLFAVVFMAGFGGFVYSLSGQAELTAAVIMLAAGSFGSHFGALATRFVHGYGIRLLFSIMLLMAGLSVALKQAFSITGYRPLEDLAEFIILATAGGMTALILIRLIIGIRKTHQLSAAK